MGKKRKHNNHNNALHIFSNDTYVEFEFTPLRYKNQLHVFHLINYTSTDYTFTSIIFT